MNNGLVVSLSLFVVVVVVSLLFRVLSLGFVLADKVQVLFFLFVLVL